MSFNLPLTQFLSTGEITPPLYYVGVFGQIDTFSMSIGIYTRSVTKIEISCNSREMTQTWEGRRDEMYSTNTRSSLPHSKGLDHEPKHWVKNPAGVLLCGKSLGPLSGSAVLLPPGCERSISCVTLTSLLGLLSHPARETKHSRFPTNLLHLCLYPTSSPNAGDPS